MRLARQLGEHRLDLGADRRIGHPPVIDRESRPARYPRRLSERCARAGSPRRSSACPTGGSCRCTRCRRRNGWRSGAISATTQPSTTSLRWVKHNLASLLTVDSLRSVWGSGFALSLGARSHGARRRDPWPRMPCLSDNRLTVQTLQAAGIHRRQSAGAGSLLRGAGLLRLGRRRTRRRSSTRRRPAVPPRARVAREWTRRRCARRRRRRRRARARAAPSRGRSAPARGRDRATARPGRPRRARAPRRSARCCTRSRRWSAHGPFLRCTRLIAVSIVEVSTAAASGVASPSAMPAPPPASATPAAIALRSPGRIPDAVEHVRGGVEPMPAEPSEQLLRAVAEEQAADGDPEQQSTELHPFLLSWFDGVGPRRAPRPSMQGAPR